MKNEILKTIDEMVSIYDRNSDFIEEIIPEFVVEVDYVLTEFILKYAFLENKPQKQDYLLAKILKLLLQLVSGEYEMHT